MFASFVHGYRALGCRSLVLLLAAGLVEHACGADAPPVQVFILAGQSNMEGQAVVDLTGRDYNEGRGTLVEVLKQPELAKRFRHLRDGDGKWTIRPDVWVHYRRENQPLLAGPLTCGFSVYGDIHHFGPELQFGHVLGQALDSRVLLIKTAWGGKSLYRDFRPPASGGTVGPYYRKMIDEVRQTLAHLNDELPDYPGKYQIAGFVWYHGWNDGVDPQVAVPEYEENLVHLIQDVRKDLEAPDLPVVIGELTGPWVKAPGEWETLRRAQAAAAARPDRHGRVRFVETHDFVRAPEDSPNPGHGHHEFGNAETYLLVGDALGRAMLNLLAKGPPDKPAPPAQPQPSSRTSRQLEGWTILVDDRLLAEPHAELGTTALRFLEARLFDIKAVLPAPRVAQLQKFRIVLDLECGKLGAMQYHPSADWLTDHGYSAELARCVHLPQAADVATRRNINEQPWVILHELAHAYHDQVLGFGRQDILAAYQRFKESGHGEGALLYNGQRVRHYGLTDHKEFFAEMTEAFFGFNDFFPFNRAELKQAEPELYELLTQIWLKEGEGS